MSAIAKNPAGTLRHRRSLQDMHQLQQGGMVILVMLILLLTRVVTTTHVTILPSRPAQPGPIWGEKPVLGYFVFTASLSEQIPHAAGLSATQSAAVTMIAEREVEALQALERESLPIIQDPELSLEQKRQLIMEMKYNERVHEAVRASIDALKSSIGTPAYARLSRWIEKQWLIERELHGNATVLASPRTYRVYATRYDSKGAYTVALPDKCLKFANGGSHICDSDGYVSGAGYTVYMSYKSGTAAVVGESGPWNVDDNFWATSSDPTPRRKFADLGLGMPEAQAAYFNGYNGGVDQFGREVTAPFGIDLARQVSIDIGLEPGKNDWIDVSFMWTEGWGSTKSKSKKSSGTAEPPPAQPTIIPIKVAEANPDGSVVHEVQEGQTLWNIAAAYQVKLGDVLRLNGLSEGALIHPGQKLLIKSASLTQTPTSTADETPTKIPSATPRRTPTLIPATEITAAISTTQTITGASPISTPSPTDPMVAASSSGIDPFLLVIAALALVGIVLFFIGQLLSRRS